MYTREGSSWTQQADLKGAEANALSRFGSAVALSSSGNTALVGARNDPGEGKGAAYVFQRVGSHWSQEGSKLTGNDVGAGLFGESVSLTGNGDFAVVGAPFARNSLPTGWVYGFESTEPPEIISASNVDEALFTAGGIPRLSGVREGLIELILEKALQQLYRDEPKLFRPTAEQYIDDMRASLASSTAPTKAGLQLMAGNQRVIAILAALEAPYGKPSKELPPAAKLAIAHLASVALGGSSAIYAKAETPRYFEPLADERTNLTYTTFAPVNVLRATWELAQRNALYGQARDGIWQSSSEESVFSGWDALFKESKVLSNSAFAALKQEIEEDGGALLKTRKQIEQLFSAGQKTSQEQMCAHGGTEEPIGTGQPLHGDTIPGVPRLECSGGALWEASRATPTSGETVAEFKLKAGEHAAAVAEEGAVMTSAAELMRPSEETAAHVMAATSQAQEQITQSEEAWSTWEGELKLKENLQGGLELFSGLTAGVFAVATGNESEGMAGLFGVIFTAKEITENNLINEPENPQAIALKDINDLRTQLSGFQQYTQEAFKALSLQVAQLSSQLAQDNYEQKLELHGITERLQNEQETIFQLQNQLQNLFSTQVKAELQTTIADSVGWLSRTGEVLSRAKLQESLVALDKYATEIANGALVTKEPQPYTFEGADRQLVSGKTGEPDELNESISYLTRFPLEQQWLTGSVPATLANTTFWAEGARAYSQLMLENASHVTEPDVASLNSLEREGLTLEKAEVPWSARSSEGRSLNTILDKALSGVEEAAGGAGVDGNKSATAELQEATENAFVANLAGPTGVSGNPTDAKLWAGVYQYYDAETIATAKYPALKYSNGGYLTATSVNHLPPALLNGVRLGVIGARSSNDEFEVETEKGEEEIAKQKVPYCKNLKLYLRGGETPFYNGVCALATEQEENERIAEVRPYATYFVEDFSLYIDQAMVQIQKQAYEGGLAALKDEPRPFASLAGAKALVESYVRLGLPQAVSSDPLLQSDVEGVGAQLLDPAPGIPSPVATELADLIGNWANVRVEQYEVIALEKHVVL